MASADPIVSLIETGRYYEVLGLERTADRMTIEIQAADTARRHPAEQRRLNAIGAVLRDPRKREVYDIARNWLEHLLRETFSASLQQTFPDLRAQAWQEIQRLLRSEFELDSVRLGPRAARSIAEHDEWVRETVVNALVPVVPGGEVQGGYLHRILTYHDLCATCRTTDAPACTHTYAFPVPAGAGPGTLLAARSTDTDRVGFVLLERACVAPRPRMALQMLYATGGMSDTWGSDITLSEAAVSLRRSNVGYSVGYVGFAAVIGLLFGSVLTGPLSLVPLGLIVGYRRRRFTTMAPETVFPRSVAVISVPAAGTLAGYVLATPATGAIIGVICALPLLLMIFLTTRMRY